jgi:hypothetical protein
MKLRPLNGLFSFFSLPGRFAATNRMDYFHGGYPPLLREVLAVGLLSG